MDNAQLEAADGSWFLFADWQGMTRIAFPGDKVKTDAGLDRPNESRPLALRPSGHVWSMYGTDIDPVTLKKVNPAERGHHSPDPMGGPEMVVEHDGSKVTIRGEALALTPGGEELRLGGTDARRAQYVSMNYAIARDGAVLVYGWVARQMQFGLVLRGEGGAPRVAFCRPLAVLQEGAPNAYRGGGSTWLADRDPVTDTAFLLELDDTGNVSSQAQAPAVAGPWVHEGRVFWQPDEKTVCEGARLGAAEKTWELAPEHCGRGHLLRASGRRLFLPWHRVTLVDLTPAKKGKTDLSRKHKAADEPMYREAERILRLVARGLLPLGLFVEWKGCTRRGKTLEPRVQLSGRGGPMSWVASFALQHGVRAALASSGVSGVSATGASSLDDVLFPATPMTADDVRAHVAMVDEAGLSRASGLPFLFSLATQVAQRKLALPWTLEAEEVALAAVLSGMRFESKGALGPATAQDLAAAAPAVRDADRVLWKAGISNTEAASFVAFAGHRRFGAEAVMGVRAALAALNPSFDQEVTKALG